MCLLCYPISRLSVTTSPDSTYQSHTCHPGNRPHSRLYRSHPPGYRRCLILYSSGCRTLNSSVRTFQWDILVDIIVMIKENNFRDFQRINVSVENKVDCIHFLPAVEVSGTFTFVNTCWNWISNKLIEIYRFYITKRSRSLEFVSKTNRFRPLSIANFRTIADF